MIESEIIDLCKQFGLEGDYVGHAVLKGGHINSTFLVKFVQDGKVKEYVLQKINSNVFKKPDEVMENIANVTNHIRRKLKAQGESVGRKVLQFKKANGGQYYTVDDYGDYWRVYKFVNNSVTYDEPSLSILRETGRAFGDFQKMVGDYPGHELHDIIPNFHNTANRYKIFESVLAEDPCDRADDVEYEIEEYLKLKDIACKMHTMQQKNQLGLRVTHNDTKSNNVLFDETTGEYLCVIDLDTVMPGLVGFDFGDAIRFGANTAAEDEVDTSKVALDLKKYAAFTDGFLSAVGNSLSENEIKTLSLGAITMTTECGLRFLTDYIDGDNYFKTQYPTHNLTRARCQLKLAKDMVQKYQQMQQIVNNCVAKHGIEVK